MHKEYPEEYLIFKPVNENPLTIDFSSVKSLDDLHGLLKEKFGFPEYYGKNLNALWDCIWEVWMWNDHEKWMIELQGVFSIREELQKEMAGILEIFQRAHEAHPGMKFIIKS